MSTKTNAARVKESRARTKQKLVEIAGNRCNICGYDKCMRALEFHHVHESEKLFGVSQLGHTRSFTSLVCEIKKCILVCANCHREIHADMHDIGFIEQSKQFDEELANQYIDDIEDRRTRDMDQCVCGNIKPATQQSCSVSCANIARAKARNANYTLPADDRIIVEKYNELGSYEAVGRMFGVTGAAIKRRIKGQTF